MYTSLAISEMLHRKKLYRGKNKNKGSQPVIMVPWRYMLFRPRIHKYLATQQGNRKKNRLLGPKQRLVKPWRWKHREKWCLYMTNSQPQRAFCYSKNKSPLRKASQVHINLSSTHHHLALELTALARKYNFNNLAQACLVARSKQD